jgi:hypothetical protein
MVHQVRFDTKVRIQSDPCPIVQWTERIGQRRLPQKDPSGGNELGCTLPDVNYLVGSDIFDKPEMVLVRVAYEEVAEVEFPYVYAGETFAERQAGIQQYRPFRRADLYAVAADFPCSAVDSKFHMFSGPRIIKLTGKDGYRRRRKILKHQAGQAGLQSANGGRLGPIVK